jgi:hypothetical protein
MFRVVIILFFFFWLVNDAQSQDSETDTLDVLAACYRIQELDKGMFSNNRHPEKSIFILSWDEKDAPKIKVSIGPHEKEHDGVHFYFYKRASLMGFDIDHWIVIDEFKIAKNTARVIFRTINSNNNWAWQNDLTEQTFIIRLKKRKGKWKILKKRVQNNSSVAKR